MVLTRLSIHRSDDRQEVPGRGRDVPGIVGRVAPERTFGLLDDPVGALDNPIEWRPERFIDNLIELGSRVRSTRLRQ